MLVVNTHRKIHYAMKIKKSRIIKTYSIFWKIIFKICILICYNLISKLPKRTASNGGPFYIGEIVLG